MIRLSFVLILTHCALFAKEVTVTGRVLSIDRIPAQGVNVILKGTDKGTATDMNGNFTIRVPEGPAVLLFMFLKQKPLEHILEVREGFQYQVNVLMANKSQTFNKSTASTGVLDVDAPVIRGRVINQNGVTLAGVHVTQDSNTFQTFTGVDGTFTLPLAEGQRLVTFRYRGSKELTLEITAKRGTSSDIEALLVEDLGKHRRRESSARLLSHEGQAP